MQGNGNFVLADDPLEEYPIKLELREDGDGDVCLVAILDDGTEAYLACYKKGMLIPFVIDPSIAQRLGIQCNITGTILQGKALPEKSHMGC